VISPPREHPPLWPDLRPETEVAAKLLASTPLYPFGKVAEKLLSLDRLDSIYTESLPSSGESFFENLLRRLGIRCDYADQELARIPESGPVVVVSNHPFGLAEAPILAFLLSKRRRDARFLANSLLTGIEIVRDHLIAVDPFGGRNATKSNLKGMRAAIDWLRTGGLLVVFPSGQVSSLRLPDLRIADPAWNESISRLVRLAGATVVPVYFHGANSAAFHIAGMIHPLLRTALLPRELFEKGGRTISVSIGVPIAPGASSALSNRQFTAYLRMRTELLQTRRLERRGPLHFTSRKQHAIAGPGDRGAIRSEIDGLEPLVDSGPFHAYLAQSQEIPAALDEIGRLREISFRAAGEGTGNARDLDRFDQYYRHLFVWNADREEIAGAYRIGLADSILAERGPNGLYSSTLFKFDRAFLRALGPALELGRSFVALEYQKEYQPLLLLWKGISRFAVQNPRYRTLFGPVSISNDYRAISRALIVEFCKAHADPSLGSKVHPKRRFRSPSLPGCDRSSMASIAEDIAELSDLIADIEPDKKGVPVLLRQYMNLGGNILEFNVDPQFSNAVDGLILVDLLKADRRLLARYMGREGLASFCAFHNV
jgi:putative hemolysin